jgi:alpha-tubulin suppressor-like RCC1 family protein
VAITAGQRHTCGLDAGGLAYCWGDNSLGQLGDGTTTPRTIPTLVIGGLSFAYLKAGDLSTCGVTTAGVAYCWGDNEFSQLGDGTSAGSASPVKVAFQP